MKELYVMYCANHPRAVEVLTKYRLVTVILITPISLKVTSIIQLESPCLLK